MTVSRKTLCVVDGAIAALAATEPSSPAGRLHFLDAIGLVLTSLGIVGYAVIALRQAGGFRKHYARSIRNPVLHRSDLHPDHPDRKGRWSQAAERRDAVGVLPDDDRC